MITDKTPIRREAILVMDSRNALRAVRNHSVNGSWSRLYKVDKHYLDLSLKVEGTEPLLIGKLVTPTQSSGQARLMTCDGGVLQEVELSASGMFRLPVPATGVYHLEMSLGEQHFVVRSVDVY
ncbi:MAG: hypothetical protein N2Z75_04120 [Meiothermus sp.]|uniref:hypothetical protein n=1 Tax=Meiothermus sp. TaxID=1955249 RepID=UPI0025CC471E|nr:hypothetical protein [Meiothermus sp.]MCS7067899.1 hypothetical protein [Meiothermus sp.]MCX7601111.1 hypothetical protein [Meiothermus sp.]MDW8425688.1 hypothetical protein [Meiothermus sp.]